MSNPFLTSSAKAGHGTIYLALLPPDTPRLRTASYQYPLKLVQPAPVRTENESRHLVHTVYLLTYGGGIVAGDSINLDVILESTTKLVLLTQGSTKLFKAPSRDVLSRQTMNVSLSPNSALCYLPDPAQPFERSCFEQQQIYDIQLSSSEAKDALTGSLCVLDWVFNGRTANGENWSFHRYGSKNEIYLNFAEGKRKLLLRDNMLLDDHGISNSIAEKMHNLAVFGTLILYGPHFKDLGQFFLSEFSALPRIGGRKWDSGSDAGDDEDVEPHVVRRLARQRQENADGFLWTAASVRGCVVVKFGAREVEGGRRWLWSMLREEGTVEREFGERSLLCLR
ncbi:UreD-domain-containing protein [Teratosphaeria nubilosa]|uniref:UreD-domain-containing protein n=1 Tax=Teratosphaeria nubilosa TaxID=161662 RepID=A0A6G1LM39_9PEZI|nr:UreD-domain-containing protein [Teratosphaeria nubilosa]